jgi:hypothetical protein
MDDKYFNDRKVFYWKASPLSTTIADEDDE